MLWLTSWRCYGFFCQRRLDLAGLARSTRLNPGATKTFVGVSCLRFVEPLSDATMRRHNILILERVFEWTQPKCPNPRKPSQIAVIAAQFLVANSCKRRSFMHTFAKQFPAPPVRNTIAYDRFIFGDLYWVAVRANCLRRFDSVCLPSCKPRNCFMMLFGQNKMVARDLVLKRCSLCVPHPLALAKASFENFFAVSNIRMRDVVRPAAWFATQLCPNQTSKITPTVSTVPYQKAGSRVKIQNSTTRKGKTSNVHC